MTSNAQAPCVLQRPEPGVHAASMNYRNVNYMRLKRAARLCNLLPSSPLRYSGSGLLVRLSAPASLNSMLNSRLASGAVARVAQKVKEPPQTNAAKLTATCQCTEAAAGPRDATPSKAR